MATNKITPNKQAIPDKITLFDYFAGQALIQLSNVHYTYKYDIAKDACQIAAAMIEERKKYLNNEQE